MKKFVIVPGLKYYFFKDINDVDIYIKEESFLTMNKLFSVIQRVAKKLNLWRVYSLFILDWKKQINECDVCIIFDQAFSTSLVKAIKHLNPNIEILIYMWNPTKKNPSIVKRLKKVNKIVSVYSFDKNDCIKHNYKFAPMLYNFDIHYDLGPINYDVIFVGYLKDRLTLLSEVYEVLDNQNFKKYFYVLNDVNFQGETPFELHTEYIKYEEYKEKMLSSIAILDIVQKNQIGLTIRTMEALCYNKKLITNNVDILNYDFYDKNDIFVIGVDDEKQLEQFLNTPYKKISNSILKKYNFTDWVKSFERRNHDDKDAKN